MARFTDIDFESPAAAVLGLLLAALAYGLRLLQRRRGLRDQLLGSYRLDRRIGQGGMGVGALGYFLLTAEPPFSGRTVLEVCSHHLRTTPLSPSLRLGATIPRELESLILACLAKSPDSRPESAAALERASISQSAGHESGPSRRAASGMGVTAQSSGSRTSRDSSRRNRCSRPERRAQCRRSGVLLSFEGCASSSHGARVAIDKGEFTVTDGPFSETKELIAGFCLMQVQTKAEAVEWTKRFLAVVGEGQSEIRLLRDKPRS